MNKRNAKAWIVTHGEYSDTSIVAAFSSEAKAQAWVDARTDLAEKASGSSWRHGQDYRIEETDFDSEPSEGERQQDLRAN